MSEVMKLEDFLQELSDNGKDARSEFHLRNEDIQTRDRVSKIRKIKKEVKQKHKLLVPVELAIPFNPTTGKVDETYSPENKFRPIKSATTVALMIKELANRNEVTKNAFMARAGVEEWDTSAVTELTDEDKAIFKKYRVPVIYTLPVVHVDIPQLTGQYGRDYTIDVERDEITGQLKNPDEEPIVLQANRFFRDMCYEEVQDYQDKIDKGEIKDTEKQQKDHKTHIYGKNPVSDDHPSNWLIVCDLPMSNSYKLSVEAGIDYANFNEDTLKSNLGLIKLSKKFKESLQRYENGEWAKYDNYFDFWEIDMICPNEGATPAEVGTGTEYSKPQELLNEETSFAKINDAVIKYLNDRDDVEKLFLASVRISPYNDQVENQITTALKTVIDTTSEWLTKEVIKRHASFLTIVLGDEADTLLLDTEDDSSTRSAGALDEAAAKKDYDLNKIMGDDEEDAVDIDLEELDVLGDGNNTSGN